MVSDTSDTIRYAENLRSLAPEVKPMAVGGFAGVLQFAGTPWPARLALRVLSIATGVQEGDYRDWAAIRSRAIVQFEHSQDRTLLHNEPRGDGALPSDTAFANGIGTNAK